MTIPDVLTGKHIGGYILREEIGQGGMAVVYRAYQPSVNRDVALKILRLDKTALSGEFRERFAREAEVIAALEHIHILPVYDYGIDGMFAYLAMRYLRGGALRDLISQGDMSLDHVAELISQIAQGLSYAHRRGIIHRDVKPSNILLDDEGNAFLTDFGLAKWAERISQRTKPGAVFGTLAYISPEQLMAKPLDHRSDLYSFGIVLYDMLAGRPPFDASTSGGVAHVVVQHLHHTPEPPSRIRPDIPRTVDEVVLKALAKKPADRYQSADEMSAALLHALGKHTTRTTTVPIAVSASPARGLQPRRWWIATALPLLIAIAAGLWWARSHQSPAEPARVLEGESGDFADTIPSEQALRAARRRLGAEGFIAYLTCNQTSEYHATQAREVAQFAGEYGLAIRVYDSNSDAYHQITELERARTDGASAFIICLLDANLLDRALKSLEEAGLPVVFLNPGERLYGGIGLAQDEFELGRAAGLYAGLVIRDEMSGQADVIILDYPALPSIVARANGIEAGVLELAPEARIVGRYPGGTVETGKESVASLIERGIHFDVIASINDAGALGAIEAMADAGFEPHTVIVSSIDAEARALEYIAEGYFMRGSVPVDREEFSRAAVNSMVLLLAGQTIPERILMQPGEIITQANLP